MEQPLIVHKKLPIIYPNGERSEFTRTHRNVNQVRVCKRCYCVYFAHELHTYLCGVIRTGQRHGGRVVRDHVQIALTGNGPSSRFQQDVVTRDIPWTKGCSKRKDKYVVGEPENIFEQDCFVHLAGHFHEIRG